MEAAHQLAACAAAERVLELVAVAPLLQGGHDLLQLIAFQAPDPPERIVDLFALDLKLSLVGQHLPWHARVICPGLDPLRPGLQDLHRTGVGVCALALVDHRAHPVAGDRAGDEDDVALLPEPRHALATVGERIDGQLDFLAALWSASWGGWGAHALAPAALSAGTGASSCSPRASSSSSSAFWACRRFSA